MNEDDAVRARDFASPRSASASLTGIPKLCPLKEPGEPTTFETTVLRCGCCCSAAIPVWRRGLFEDLATAKHGVSLLCRDDYERRRRERC